jgi:hypothetical protein
MTSQKSRETKSIAAAIVEAGRVSLFRADGARRPVNEWISIGKRTLDVMSVPRARRPPWQATRGGPTPPFR